MDNIKANIQAIIERGQVPMFANAVDTLEERVSSVEELVTGISSSLESVDLVNIEAFRNDMSKQVRDLAEQVTQLRETDVPSMKRVNEFFAENSAFIQDAVAAKGHILGLNSRVDALDGRVRDIEQRHKDNWTRTQWLITSALTVAGIAAGALVTYYLK